MLSAIVVFILIAAGLYCLLALVLICSQRVQHPDDIEQDGPFGFDPDDRRYREPSQPLELYQASDGAQLGYRHYKSGRENPPLLLFCHGSTNYGGMYEPLAQMIAGSGLADVVLPDMRGHGPLFEERGIARYVGQLEDDIALLIEKVSTPEQQIIVGGHSLGGGFAIRFSTGKHKDLVDKAFLLAPYLSTRAPTQRPNAGGFTRVLYRRALGLVMLGVPRLFNLFKLPVVQFNFSDEYRKFERSWLSTDKYNFAMTMGFGPRQRWTRDVKNLPPFLLVIGEEDEVFYADQYEPTMSAISDKGQYRLLPGVDHIQASQDQRTLEAFRHFLNG